MVRNGNILDYHAATFPPCGSIFGENSFAGYHQSVLSRALRWASIHRPKSYRSAVMFALPNSARLAQLPSAANAALALAPDQTEKKVKL
jgi:hypothetical protein